MEEKYNIQLVEDYVNGLLDPADQEHFEQRLEKDEGLAEEVAFYRDLSMAAHIIEEEEMETAIKLVEGELEATSFFQDTEKMIVDQPNTRTLSSRGGIRRSLRPMLMAAASIAVLLIAGLWYSRANYSNNALVATYGNQLIIDNSIRNGDAVTPGPFQLGTEAVEQGNYDKAIQIFGSFSEEEEAYSDARFYLGATYFMQGDYDQAIANFKTLTGMQHRWRGKAEWFIVLAMIKNGASQSAIDTALETIAEDPGHSYQKQAISLKEDLNSFWRKLQ